MARQTLRSAAWFLAGVALLGGAPALACDAHSNLEANKFLAYLELRGLSEAEVRALEQEAIDKYHARRLELARGRFLRRFEPDPAPPVREALSSQPDIAETTSL